MTYRVAANINMAWYDWTILIYKVFLGGGNKLIQLYLVYIVLEEMACHVEERKMHDDLENWFKHGEEDIFRSEQLLLVENWYITNPNFFHSCLLFNKIIKFWFFCYNVLVMNINRAHFGVVLHFEMHYEE
jgi:hypothetical protein